MAGDILFTTTTLTSIGQIPYTGIEIKRRKKEKKRRKEKKPCNVVISPSTWGEEVQLPIAGNLRTTEVGNFV